MTNVGQVLLYFLGKRETKIKVPAPGDLYFGGETYNKQRSNEGPAEHKAGRELPRWRWRPGAKLARLGD